jgi:hypothetical protein
VNASSLPFPLSTIVDDVQRCFDSKLYYPALAVALTLPEICVALTLDNTEFIKEKHYVGFIDKYTTERELGLPGISCYRLRGGVIHRANAAGHPFLGRSHVIFTVPESKTTLHAFSIQADDKFSAMFDLRLFLAAMITAVQRWHAEHGTDPKVLENLPNLLSWRPNGILPFVQGAPVVGSGK